MDSFQPQHSRHRQTSPSVKVQGVLVDSPNRQRVSVYDSDDWALIYRNPKVRVGCIAAGCDTLLTAKRLNSTGTKFLAIRPGFAECGHFNVKTLPAATSSGGGEETAEHDWVKGRLARIAQRVQLEAIIEEPRTHADVYLPAPKIALEYQRVHTDFPLRTLQRRMAGARLTLWLIREQPRVKGRKSALQRSFDEQVFQQGGLYLSIVDREDHRKNLRPWEDPATLDRRAWISVSGSTVRILPAGEAFGRRPVSFATFLADVANGTRLLTTVPIRPADGSAARHQKAWVLRTELEQHERSLAASAQLDTAPVIEGADPLPPNETATDEKIVPPVPVEHPDHDRDTISMTDNSPQSAPSQVLQALQAPARPTWLQRLRRKLKNWLP